MHDPLISTSYFPKNNYVACAVTCKKKDALKLVNDSKFQNEIQQVGISKFHYEQLAKYHYYKDIQRNLEPVVVLHEDNGINANLIRLLITSSIHQSNLIRMSWNFRHYNHVTYYTDGSVQNLGNLNIKSASAWIEISTVTPTSYTTAISNEWTSSTKAELIALVTALITAPAHSQVDIYLDSKAVIEKFKSLAKYVDTFKYTRDQLKESYSSLCLWYMTFVIMERLDLKVILHKVKAHSGNVFNDMVDQLAKDACLLEETISFAPTAYYKVAPMYKNTEIQTNLRRFVKDIQAADHINDFIALNRNFKYSYHRIDWLNTFNIIKGDSPSMNTDFKSSYKMSKKVRLLTEELPTLDFLTHTKPEVYNNQWLCPFCNNKEDFNHIWTCSYHIERMQGIVASSKTILRSRLFLIVENLKEDNIELNNILDHGSW